MQELINFRNKYPQYNDLDDMTLATMLARKYPVYADLPEKLQQEKAIQQPTPQQEKVLQSPAQQQPIQKPEGMFVPPLAQDTTTMSAIQQPIQPKVPEYPYSASVGKEFIKEAKKSALATAGGAVKGLLFGAPEVEKSKVFGKAMQEYPESGQMGAIIGGIAPLVVSGGATAPIETAVIAGTKAIPSTLLRFGLGKAAHGTATYGIPALVQGAADVLTRDVKLSDAVKSAVLDTATGAALGLTAIPESKLTRYLSNAAIGLTSSAMRKDTPLDAAFNTGLFIAMQAVNDRSVMPEIRQYARNQAANTVAEFINVKHPDIQTKYGEYGVKKMSDAIIDDALSMFPEGKPITARDFDKMNGVVRTRLNSLLRDLQSAETQQRAAQTVNPQVSRNIQVITELLKNRASGYTPKNVKTLVPEGMEQTQGQSPQVPMAPQETSLMIPEAPRGQVEVPKPSPQTVTKPVIPLPEETPSRVSGIDEAGKHGRVVGIDAATKLPVIDMQQPPALQEQKQVAMPPSGQNVASVPQETAVQEKKTTPEDIKIINEGVVIEDADFNPKNLPSYTIKGKNVSMSLKPNKNGTYDVFAEDAEEASFWDLPYERALEIAKSEIMEKELAIKWNDEKYDFIQSEIDKIKTPKNLKITDAYPTKNGTWYIEIQKSLPNEEYRTIKARISDHEPSPFREQEFGIADISIEGYGDINKWSKEQWKDVIGRLAKEINKIESQSKIETLQGAEQVKPQVTEKEVVTKQPWEMTREEYIRATTTPEGYEQYQRDLQLRKQGKATTGFAQQKEAMHKVAIMDAIADGNPVPATVLAEYPDLQVNTDVQQEVTQEVTPDVMEDSNKINPLMKTGQVKVSAARGFSQEQADYLVNKLLNIRDKIIKYNDWQYKIDEPLGDREVPYLTPSEARALEFGNNIWNTKSKQELFNKKKEKFVSLGLFDAEKNELTALGKYAVAVNKANSDIKPSPNTILPETTEIKVPGDGIFKIKNNISAINTLLQRLRAKGQVPKEPLPSATDVKPEGEVPSGYGFPKIPIKKTMRARPEFESAVEMPEMVKLAKELSGKTPIIKHLTTAYGKFYLPYGQIKLDPEIFKDELLSGQVLAHEIGHLIDWLPEHTLARGNLIGRLHSLQKYLMQTFGGLNNKTIKQELINLTQYWHPFDEGANPKFTQYRYKPQELYAEAISVLLNEPDKVKEIAPNFYSAFKENLYKKPEVEQALTNLRSFLASGEENILKTREEDIRKMFREGEELYSERRKIKRESQQLRWIDKFQKDYIDKNMPVIKMVEKDIQMGKKVNPDNDPRYYLEEYNYLSGKVKNVLYDVEQKVMKPVLEAGITTEDLGLYLFLKRVITERADIANPLGFNRTTAEKQLNYLFTKIGRNKEDVLKKAIDNFREIQNNVLTKAVESEVIKPEVYDAIATNPNYATFQVLDYLDEYVTPSIIRQKGTLREIANPIDASVLKMISTIRAVEKNKVRKVVVDYLKELHPTDIEEAKPIRYGKYKTEFKERSDKGLIVLRENGVLRGYYTDPYIADTVMYTPVGTPSAIVSMLSWANRSWFRPIYVNLNLGFQSYNLLRDFLRAWKLTPDVPFWKMIETYRRALPKAKMRAMGDFTDPVIREMQENGMFGFTYNQMFRAEDDEVDEITHLFRLYQLQKAKGTQNPVKFTLDKIKELGDIIEGIPKITGYMVRKEAQPTRPIKEVAHEVRVYSGSPDFLRKGERYYYYNNLLLFSNAIKEGIRGDFEGAFKNPRTRNGYWWKTFNVNILPKVIVFLGTLGFFGKDIQDDLDRISEYDKINYTCIPLGRTEDDKVIYFRIPNDEVGRIIGGVFWKGINTGKRVSEEGLELSEVPEAISTIMMPFAQQIPSLAPSVEIPANIAMYLLGQNPYDFYKGKTILTQDEMQAGGLYKIEPLLGWIGDRMGVYGLRVSMRTSMDEPPIVKTIRFTPVIGRYFKVSDYGLREKEMEEFKPIWKESASRRIERKKLRREFFK